MAFYFSKSKNIDVTKKGTVLDKSVFKRVAIFSISVLILSSIFVPFIPQSSYAKINSATPDEEAQSTSYYRLLRDCVKNNMESTIQLTGADGGNARPNTWFNDRNAYGFVHPTGKIDCKDAVAPALRLWGWGSNTSSFLRDIGYTYDQGTARWTGPSNGDDRQVRFDMAVQSKYYTSNFAGDPSQSGQARYAMFSNVFSRACSAVSLGPVSEISNSSYRTWVNQASPDRGTEISSDLAGVNGLKTGPNSDYNVYFAKVNVLDTSSGSPRVVPYGYAYQTAFVAGEPWFGRGQTPIDSSVNIYGYHNRSVVRSCHEIQKGVNDNAAAALGWLRENPGSTPPQSPGATDIEGEEDNSTSCGLDGIGWMVCPLVTAAAIATDALWGWIITVLEVQPLNTDTRSNSNVLYKAWEGMRNVANIAFIIAFIIIIYAQLTGMGVSNYGVKKLLPRLVIAAILVNISYWIAAIAVDISNILGNNIYNILRSGIDVGVVQVIPGVWEQIAIYILSLGTIGAGTIAGVTFAAGGVGTGSFLIWALVVFALSVILALVIAFVILAVRQALIIMLIVVSPLAFVAMLLPNTEKFFTLWRRSFTTLLIFFPLFAFLFGGSYLAGRIIIGSATNEANETQMMLVLVGLAVTILPLWLTPLVMRFSSGVLGQVAGIVNNKSKGLSKGLIDRAKGVRNRKAGLAFGESMNKAGAKNPFGRVYRAVQNSKRNDERRRKIIDNSNQIASLGSAKGVQLDLQEKLSTDQTEATNLEQTARYAELKSDGTPGGEQFSEIAAGAQEVELQKNILRARGDSAQRVLQQEYAKAIDAEDAEGAALRAAAGGIDAYGASRVRASAKSTIAEAQHKAIEAEKTTMSQMTAEKLKEIYRSPPGSISDERRAAAVGLVAKKGSDADIMELFDDMNGVKARYGDEAGVTMQQQLFTDIGGRKPAGIGNADMTNLSNGNFEGPFEQKLAARLEAGKISGEAFHNITTDELTRINAMRDRGVIRDDHPGIMALRKQISDYRRSSTYREPAPEVGNLINQFMTSSGPASGGAPTSTPPGTPPSIPPSTTTTYRS